MATQKPKTTKEKEYENLVEACIKVIREEKIVFVNELVAFLPVSRSTFYNHKLDKLDTLKEELEKNKIKTKHKLRKDWEDAKAPILQIALYKLLATPEERQALAGQQGEDDNKLPPPIIIFNRKNNQDKK